MASKKELEDRIEDIEFAKVVYPTGGLYIKVSIRKQLEDLRKFVGMEYTNTPQPQVRKKKK